MEHNHDHDHDHDEGPIVVAGLSHEHADTASRSLSDALGWSFKLLSVIMVFVAVGFFFTGVQQIKNNQVGLKKVFGKVVDEVGPGLAVTWPFPIGQIEVVSVKPQDLTIEDLWMYESPEDKLKSLSQRSPMGPGLRPGWDGVLYTGDKNLLHLKLVCSYVVSNARKFKAAVPPKFIVKDFKREDLVVEPVRSAVVIAAIHLAAQWTAERIQDRSKDFLADVQLEAEDILDKQLDCGIRIINLTIPSEGLTRPLAVRPMYDAAQAARSQKDTLISTALGDANNTLNAACGAEARKILVGGRSLYGQGNAGSQASALVADDVGLIGRYNQARDTEERARLADKAVEQKGAHDEAEAILAKIDETLLSNAVGGEAFKIIADARTAVTTIKQNLEGRTKRFDELKTEYLKNPRFMLDSLWAQARQELLNDPSLIKFYVNAAGGKTVITVNHDPDMIREIQKKWQESSRKSEEAPSAPPGP